MKYIEDALDFLSQPLLRTKLGTITLLWIFTFAGIILGFYMLSFLIRRILQSKIFPNYDIDKGTRSAYSRILHYTLMTVGLFTAFNVMGVNLTVLFAGGAALLVGIGFGIQNIANNFISGVIILFERPIKVGDYIEVDGILDTVQSISGRSSKIITNSQIVIIVPNSSFLEKNVVNWSYTKATRIGIPIGVKYGSDLLLVKKVLLDLAAAESKVLEQPEPYVFCEAYGDSSINLELSVWIDDQSLHRKIKSELNYAIDSAFKAHNIEIPFPQRDLHLKSGFSAPAAGSV
jgi:potassium efflux system protein